MNNITFPLKLRMQGPEVGNLQAALRLLIDRSIILQHDEISPLVLVALTREQSAQTYGDATRMVVRAFQEERQLTASGEVDEATAYELNRLLDELIASSEQQPTHLVRGTVRLFDNSPGAGITVTAVDLDLRHKEELGKTQTDKSGAYEIHYSAHQFRRAEKGNADLVVTAFGADGAELATSPILFNAPSVAEIDLVIPAEKLPTLFERIARELPPLLETVGIEKLEEDEKHHDLTFLSGETGFEKPLLARFALAHTLAHEGLPAEFWFALLGGSFYHFAENQSLAEQLTDVLSALPSLDATAVRKSLVRSFSEREIPNSSRKRIDRWIEIFLKLAASRLVTDATTPSFVKLALEDAGIKEAEKQQMFARLFNEHKALTPELLAKLEKQKNFHKSEIDDLRASFQLAELTGADFFVVKAIKDQFGVRQPEQIRSLARRSEDEWVELVQTKHAASQITLPTEVGTIAGTAFPEAEVYGKTLARQFRDAFPTTAFAGGLERALQSGGTRGLTRPEALSRFLNTHEDFELLDTPVDEFLTNNISFEFGSLAKDATFRIQLKAVQRVFKLAPNFAATDTLLADDLHSAQQVYREGQSEFVRRYANRPGFTAESARLAWNRAADTHAAALTIVADLKALDAEGLPLALQNNNAAALSRFPNWDNLFKAGDLCECEHCNSVLGPAAYFADILSFLGKRPSKNAGVSCKDILFERRPDLGYLELNCANALTPFPYVDTVCEVLEDVIAAGENDVELVGFTTVPAPPAAKAAVANAFATKNIKLGDDFTLSQVKASNPNPWVVHGDDVTYLLKKKSPSLNFFAEILRNTKASAAELRAYPQYVNSKAYEKLRAAKYPLTLPFDLFAEEVRAGFQKTNLQRWDLMSALRGTAPPNNPTDGEIAAEYFGIYISAKPTDPSEKLLILVADPTVAGQQEIWGETGPTWLTFVGNVKSFLQKTRLEYNELLTLLDLKFINPAGDIAVLPVNPNEQSCDTDKKLIQVLDEIKLDRIHRFLRLWRKLKGWKMWELDLVLRHPRIGATSAPNGSLDETFLINLFYFSQLRNRLGAKTSVEQLCALFGDLNSASRFSKLHEKRENALYQNLFMNKRLVNPLDPAFELDPATNAIKPVIDPSTGLPELDPTTGLPKRHQISDHHPAILAALGIRESDLILLKALTKASNGNPYITDELTLANLSFLWRHAWLAKLLKFKPEDWKILLKLFQLDLDEFASPRAAWEFVKDIDNFRSTGFSPDEANWLLAADRSAKAATKEVDASRFLAALRKGLQAVQAQFDPGQYDFLNVVPPRDVDSLTALLTALLQNFNRDEADTQLFIATLRNDVRQEKVIGDLPSGFDFQAPITGAPNNIAIAYEPRLLFNGSMTPAQRVVLLNDPSIAGIITLTAYQDAIQKLFLHPGQPATVIGLPTGFTFPPGITGGTNNIDIRYEPVLRFNGVMTIAEQTSLLSHATLSGVTGIASYQQAIADFFEYPRLAIKFFQPVFTTTLEDLPPAVDFKSLPEPTLTAKISYDAEQRLLRFAGSIMTPAEKAMLDALSSNGLYLNAVNTLFTQPQSINPPDDRIWLMDGDLTNPDLAVRLATALKKALVYLSRTLSESLVVQQSSSELGITEALTRYLFVNYIETGNPLLDHFTGAFVGTTGVVDYATLKPTFDQWFRLTRAATVLKKWKITLTELMQIKDLSAGAQLIDLLTLPLKATATIASLQLFIRTSRLIRLRDTLPETQITLLEILTKLNNTGYLTTAFAADVQLMNDTWQADDVAALVASLNLTYPADYLLAENWERLRRAIYFIENLNARADVVKRFAAASMGPDEARTLNDLLRSKFGTETWLTLSTEIQDVLRERKRDALAAFRLAHAQPLDRPTDKWENTNDLYAYHLLDVEMSSCQLTSRLVQASGSVQLFVQRCFMGLEPKVAVKDGGLDGDSAWRWWKWMRKYRVWEANRKVFLWPENWVEPQLKRDRSQFFKDFENELLQNEINQFTVETAFTNYLQKLHDVAQLEIAGFYQEDDGDNTFIHVFGRTVGAEPHLYYYRRYDYRQWTPWEKVDLDIQHDYLIPAVVSGRLFLFWPVFTEAPDEKENSTVKVPKLSTDAATSFTTDKIKKRLRLQLAVSEFRQGKWTPKKVSKDYAVSEWYDVEIVRKHYYFWPIDRSEIDGRFGIKFEGYSFGSDGKTKAQLFGAFELAGCDGVPQLAANNFLGAPIYATPPEPGSTGPFVTFLKWLEVEPRPTAINAANDFTLVNYARNQLDQSFKIPVLQTTPGTFKMSPPWHLSYFDRLRLDGLLTRSPREQAVSFPIGTWLPFFYNDQKRTFFVLPVLEVGNNNIRLANIGSAVDSTVRYYYPEMKKLFRQFHDTLEEQVQDWLNSLTLPTAPLARRTLEEFLSQQFPEGAQAAYGDGPLKAFFTDEQVFTLLKRLVMRFIHHYLGGISLDLLPNGRFHFKNFYHPLVCDFASLVYNPLQGIPALMRRETQLKNTGFSFQQNYRPTLAVVQLPADPKDVDSYPDEYVDFTPDGSFSPYNWELFFHLPLLIGNTLSRELHFEEARDWYHFIFNPIGLDSAVTGGSIMSKYWITKPFFETADPQYVQQRIENILRMLAGDTSVPGFSLQAKKDLEDQVRDWRTYPFEPHRIANYRTVAYQKTVVMKYLDNLIAWGDNLFRQDSMESINEATQLYILAAEILGPRQKKIPAQAKPPVESFNELEEQFDAFSNALVEVENLVPPPSGVEFFGPDPPPLPMLYFCIPQNDKLLGYWDTVADRLYKIRHCMNIEGVVRQLALFEPPIDPAALVKAVAAGVDISSALADLNAPLPLYRFNILLQKANEVCNDVKALGGALLGALEKKDAEALGLLRQSQEIQLQEAVKALRQKQIDEAKENLEGIKRSKIVAETRRNYYRDIERLNTQEKLHLEKLGLSHTLSEAAQGVKLAASIISILPAIDLGASGFGGSPLAKFKIGGLELGQAANLASDVLSFISQIAANDAAMAASKGGFDRRWDDWKLQELLAGKELDQMDRQIAAAELRLAIAEKELDNHLLQIENSKAIDAFMRSKYTNQDLYQWQVTQISLVYFQSYKLAYDLAKQAERCLRFELGLQDISYINFGYWDSLKKGLLSGEKLQYDLRRLDAAYLERNGRERELTKNVSLALVDPLALVKLRETGRCFFSLPEELFDRDFPGHYFRRIKSVSLTLPCVVGPYTTISCTLRLLRNSIRINTGNGDNGYPRNVDGDGLPADDGRFVENNIPVKAIAASNAQNDSGIFELNFRDERYLPFEGAGVITNWSLELFNSAAPDFGKALRQFDYDTISDAVLHVKYTAREDAGPFKSSAVANLEAYFKNDGTPFSRIFDLRREFSGQWQRFVKPTNPASANTFELELIPNLFSFRDQGKILQINRVTLVARCTGTGAYQATLTPPTPTLPQTMNLAVGEFGELRFKQKDVDLKVDLTTTAVKWEILMTGPSGKLQSGEVQDVVLVLGYEWT
ncbi:MAG: neuraminidase-like domain-containing protein [Pyrinomonadaceae bacterium]